MFFTSKNVSITVTDLNDNGPFFTSGASASEAEGTAANNVVYTATAIDFDVADSLTYTLAGADAAQFGIDASTGDVRFLASPDFEAPTDDDGNDVYQITVLVSDGVHGNAQDVSITVTDVNDVAPTITSAASANEAENTAASSVVYTATASDPDTIGSLSFSLTGTDAALFSVDPGTGEVRFLASPDFESPADSDADNAYQVTVHANDGVHDIAQDVVITVTDVNDVAPVIGSSASASAPEGTAANSVVYTVTASDPDTVGSLSYLLTGSDAALFDVDANSGEVRFHSPPDFEAPHDADTDNAYQITVHANDGVHDTTKDVTITVTDVVEVSPGPHLSPGAVSYFDAIGGVHVELATQLGERGGVGASWLDGPSSVVALATDTLSGVVKVTGSGFDDLLVAGSASGTLSGLAGDDTLEGGDGNDSLQGGAGADALNGGAGIDRALYSDATAGLTVDLAVAANNTGIAAGDTFDAIENLYGSNFDDILRGDGGANRIWGAAGNDTLEGGDGNDTLYGGAGADMMSGGTGTDRVSYSDAPAGLTVDLAVAANNTGIAAGDTFDAIENLYGSNFADTLRGDSGANTIWGAAGDDTLEGGDGKNSLYGGAGNDTLNGGAGNDRLDGGSGADVMYGGGGNDTFFVDDPGDQVFAGQNLVGDPSFELLNGNWVSQGTAATSDSAHSGAAAGTVGGTLPGGPYIDFGPGSAIPGGIPSGNASWSQTVTTTVGDQYSIDFSLAQLEPGHQTSLLTVFFDGMALYSERNPSVPQVTSGWQKFHFDAFATETSSTFSLVDDYAPAPPYTTFLIIDSQHIAELVFGPDGALTTQFIETDVVQFLSTILDFSPHRRAPRHLPYR